MAESAANQAPRQRPWKVLVATDGSPCAAEAQEYLIRLPFPGKTEVRVVAVAANPFGDAGCYGDTGFVPWQLNEELLAAEEEAMREAARRGAQRFSGTGWRVSTAFCQGNTCGEILGAAEEFGADLILVGTRGLTGAGRFLLGSTARSVARSAPVSVLVARSLHRPLRRLVLAVDGSDHASRAVEMLVHLPLPADAQITAVHVVRPYHPVLERLEILPGGRERFEPVVEASRQGIVAEAEKLAGSACERLTTAGKTCAPTVLTGDSAEELLRLAERGEADLIVLGARGVSALKGLLIGSVADRVLENAPCSVLLVR